MVAIVECELPKAARIVHQILQRVCKNTFELDEHAHLFDTGILDSFGVINLITLLEQEFALKIDTEELTMDNFKSVACIADGEYIQSIIHH